MNFCIISPHQLYSFQRADFKSFVQKKKLQIYFPPFELQAKHFQSNVEFLVLLFSQCQCELKQAL